MKTTIEFESNFAAIELMTMMKISRTLSHNALDINMTKLLVDHWFLASNYVWAKRSI